MNHDYDAILIGGGPAGSSAAAILAEYGHRVLVLERDKFPRYHIGESLIPFTFEPLKRIGMIPKMKASHFVKKYSVTFVQPDGKRSQPFYFFNRYDKETVAQTWQVLRSEFDQMLARQRPREGRGGPRGDDREPPAHGRRPRHRRRGHGPHDRPHLRGARAHHARLLGQGGVHLEPPRLAHADPYLNKIAVWTYYKGSKREPGIDEGETTVAFVPDKGWFWHIPQHNDMVSVGVVAEGKYLTRGGVKDPREIFHREVEENLWIKDHLSVGDIHGRVFRHQRIQPLLALLRRAGACCCSAMRSRFSIRSSAAASCSR